MFFNEVETEFNPTFIPADDFNDVEAGNLATSLKDVNCKYTGLNLVRAKMTDKGVVELAEALKINKSVTYLNLQWISEMTDTGLKSIADMLVVNSTITTIYLEKPSKVTAEGGRYLAEKVAERTGQFPGITFEIAFNEGLPAGVAEAYQQKLKEQKVPYENEVFGASKPAWNFK